jgi:hypothetical protein
MISHVQLSTHILLSNDGCCADGGKQAELLQSLYAFNWLETISLLLSKRLATVVQLCDGSLLYNQQTANGFVLVFDPH